MDKKDNLAELIHSLTKAEKRYFSTFANREKGKKNYLQVFDAIRNTGDPDKSTIKKSLSDLHGLKDLHRNKAYLHSLLLDSLHFQHSETSIAARLYKLTHVARILFDKALYKQAYVVIRKAKKIAYRHDRLNMLPEIVGFEGSLNISNDFRSNPNTTAEILKVDRLCSNYNQYLNLATQVGSSIINYEIARSKKQKADLDKIMQHPILAKKETLSVTAEYAFYGIWFFYYYTTSNHSMAHKSLQSQLKLIENNKEKFENKELSHYRTMGNLILCQINLKKYKEAFLSIEKMKNIRSSSKSLNEYILTNSYTSELDLYIRLGWFEEGIGRIKNIDIELKMIQVDTLVLYTNFAYIYFGAGRYRQALDWLTKVLNIQKTSVRQDAQSTARILYLITRFEMDAADIFLKNIAQSTNYFHKKIKYLFRSEKLIIDFFYKEIRKYPTAKELRSAFIKLRKNITELFEKYPEEKAILNNFDILSWINSKIENRSFAKLVKEKVTHAS